MKISLVGLLTSPPSPPPPHSPSWFMNKKPTIKMKNIFLANFLHLVVSTLLQCTKHVRLQFQVTQFTIDLYYEFWEEE